MESHRQNLLVYSKKKEQIFDLEKESRVFEFKIPNEKRRKIFKFNQRMIDYVLDDLKSYELDEILNYNIHFLELKIESLKISPKLTEDEKNYFIDLFTCKYNYLKEEKKRYDKIILDFNSNIKYYSEFLNNLDNQYYECKLQPDPMAKVVKNKCFELGCEIQKELSEKSKKLYIWTRLMFQKMRDACDFIEELHNRSS